MKRRISLSLAMCILMTGCLGSGTNSEKALGNSGGDGSYQYPPVDNAPDFQSEEGKLEGVAATGAPVVNGRVKGKDATGKEFESDAPTDSQGRYSIDLNKDTFTPPFIIHVTAPTGDRLVTLATQKDITEKKQINVTPLTKLIVANVFEKAELEDILAVDLSTATDLEEKVSQKKAEVAESLKVAFKVFGVKEDFDLMSGRIDAGSNSNFDALLDAIDVKVSEENTSVAATISLKAGPELVKVTPDKIEVSENITEEEIIDTSKTVVGGLKDIKLFLGDFIKDYSTFASCNQALVGENGSINSEECPYKNISEMHAVMMKHMHPQYLYDGLTAEEDSYSWFCSNLEELDSDVTSANDCKGIDVEVGVSFKDVSIISFNKEKKEAVVSMNIYINDNVRWNDTEYVRWNEAKKTWQFAGNNLAHNIDIDSKSFVVVDRHGEKERFSRIEIWPNGSEIVEVDKEFTLRPYSIDKEGKLTLNTVLEEKLKAANGVDALVLKGARAYEGAEIYLSLAGKECFEPDYCSFNWDSNKLLVDAETANVMDQNQLFILSYEIDGVTKEDHYFVRKPLIITEANEADYVPSFEDEENICNGTRSSYTLNSGNLTYLDHFNLYFSWTLEDSWNDGEIQVDFDGDKVTETVQSGMPNGAHLNDSNFYLSSDDVAGRQYVKEIRCGY